MRKLIFTLIISGLSIAAFSQGFGLELDYGLGQYSMKDLKSFNQEILKTLPVNARVTDNFPVTSYWKAGILPYSNKTLSLGLTGLYNTTGARIDYIDYSGEYKLDEVLSSYGFGLIFRIALETGKLKFSENNELIYAFTRCKMSETILDSKQEYNFRSQSFQFEPGIRLAYEIAPFQLAVKIGYNIDFKGTMKLKGDKERYLTNPDSKEKVKTDWSGFRMGISLYYSI
jgi:hypothetical protein